MMTIFLLLFFSFSLVSAQLNPILNIRQGSLIGREEFVNRRRIYSFRGIKYAEVPLGER